MALKPESLEALRIERLADPSRYQTRPRHRLWLLGVALALLLAGAWLVFGARGPVVATVRVEGGGASVAALNASGYVVARRLATVSSKATGRIAEVLFEEGAAVERGQVLARLESETARAESELARRQLEAAVAAREEVRVRLEEAERNLGRATRLRESGLVAEGALDAARAEVKALQARLASTDGQQQAARSALAVRLQALEDLEIRAPFAGVVISKDAQPGEMVSPISAGGGFTRTGIATIVDMDSREIEVDVNEAFINRVRPGQPVEATLDAYPDWTIAATVENIVPTADRTKATVRVRIAFRELDPRILPDMGIKVRFLEEPGARAMPRIRVPESAVVRADGAAFVWLVRDDRLESRKVTLGESRDGQINVLTGLSGGEELVANPVDGLRDGGPVRRAEN